jgi:protease IV
MKMQPSIIRSIVRAFLTATFSILGLLLGIMIVFFMLAAVVKDTDDELKSKSFFSPVLIENAQNNREKVSESAPVILKLTIDGLIGTEKLNMHTIQQQLTESREGIFKNDRVKGLLVHINSPGGTVIDSDGIYHAIKDYKEKYKIPVYAYVDGLCASGGMYIASACDQIYASNVSLIGSVGVLSPAFFNMTGLMEKIGVYAKVLSAGKGKDDLNPFRPWKEGEEDAYKGIIDNYYSQFVDIVTESRSELKRTRLINEFGAHVFPASRAKEYGFIDEAGSSYHGTLKELAQAIGVEDDYYQVVKLERKVNFSDFFTNGSMMLQGHVKHQVELGPDYDLRLMNKFLYLYLPQTQ